MSRLCHGCNLGCEVCASTIRTFAYCRGFSCSIPLLSVAPLRYSFSRGGMLTLTNQPPFPSFFCSLPSHSDLGQPFVRQLRAFKLSLNFSAHVTIVWTALGLGAFSATYWWRLHPPWNDLKAHFVLHAEPQGCSAPGGRSGQVGTCMRALS